MKRPTHGEGEMIQAIGYVRVSTERQAAEDKTSLADQEAAVTALAAKLGASIGGWFRDAGASGATVEGRPAFRELLAWCAANRRPPRSSGLVLVLNDSRFGRFPDPEESAYWRQHLSKLGWVVRFAEGDEVQGDLRAVVRALGAAQASEYRRNLVANTRRGKKGGASQGFWVAGRAPFGYRRAVVGSGRVLGQREQKGHGERVKLTPFEEEARIVRWAFERYDGGTESLGSLVEQLLVRVPARRWSRHVVHVLLANPAYRGAVVGGRRRSEEPDLYGCEDAHTPLVPAELWQRVQARLVRNSARGKGVRSYYLISGLLRCCYCREAYTGGGGGRSQNINPARSHRHFYRDNGGVSGVCPGMMGTVMRHRIDEAVVEMIGDTISKSAVRRSIEKAIDAALAAPAQEGPRALRAERTKLEARLARLVDAVGSGTLLPGEAGPALELARAAIAELEARDQVARFELSRSRNLRGERDRLMAMVRSFRDQAAALEGPALRAVVEPWIGEATFDKVNRSLSLGIRRLPAAPSLVVSHSRPLGRREQGALLFRTTSLLVPGHGYRVARAAAELRAGSV